METEWGRQLIYRSKQFTDQLLALCILQELCLASGNRDLNTMS